MRRAEQRQKQQGVSEAKALSRVWEELTAKPNPLPGNGGTEPLFFCDAGLGGLARWLRAAGYAALWESGIDDDDLLRRARQQGAIVLTTDSLLMERRVLRDRCQLAFWLPPTLGIPEQLALVFEEYGLRAGQPRCMSCGAGCERLKKRPFANEFRHAPTAGWTSILSANNATNYSGTARTGAGSRIGCGNLARPRALTRRRQVASVRLCGTKH
jgi:uncharacterized protein with PIN domain